MCQIEVAAAAEDCVGNLYTRCFLRHFYYAVEPFGCLHFGMRVIFYVQMASRLDILEDLQDYRFMFNDHHSYCEVLLNIFNKVDGVLLNVFYEIINISVGT